MEDASMTRENGSESGTVEPLKAASAKAVDDQLIDELVHRAQAEGLQLTGEGGLLQQLTKRLLGAALEGEITDHLGHDKHDPAGRNGGNFRNGKRSKTVLTDVGPVETTVPREVRSRPNLRVCGGGGQGLRMAGEGGVLRSDVGEGK
jgi:putative transposase